MNTFQRIYYRFMPIPTTAKAEAMGLTHLVDVLGRYSLWGVGRYGEREYKCKQLRYTVRRMWVAPESINCRSICRPITTKNPEVADGAE